MVKSDLMKGDSALYRFDLCRHKLMNECDCRPGFG